jgi:Tol biopolymer transport system component
VGDGLVEEIAQLTGELYEVTEVAPDGRAVRWSPDGRYAAYETGTGPGVTTHVVALEGGEGGPVAHIPASGLVFAPSGNRVAYLAIQESVALRAALTDLARQAATGDRASRARVREEMARLSAEHTHILIRELPSSAERRIAPTDAGVLGLTYGPDGTLYFVGNPRGDPERTDIYAISGYGRPQRLTDGPGQKGNPRVTPGGTHLVYELEDETLGVRDLGSGEIRFLQGSPPVISADGSALAYVGVDGDQNTVNVVRLEPGSEPAEVTRIPYPVARMTSRACSACPELSSLALSPDGSRVAFQAMPREDWEVFIVGSDGGDEIHLTREIQHDLFPRFLEDGRLLALKGEGRHRRSHLYELETGEVTWLFHNNTVRTVAPEYEWAPSPDGTKLLIVAERDGDTVSPERGVYLLDLARKVTRADVLHRVRSNLATERSLQERTREMYRVIADDARAAVADVSTSQVFEYERDLFRFGSKHITQPGNALAIDYLVDKLRSFGYEPELQWFDARGVRSANVIATLPGTANPELVYAVSSHFDSSARGPGADDNTSGTAALLEAARVLAQRPLPATIEFAFFTGEEAGLLGSREYVRRSVEAGDKLVGALNNDMVGWAENHRLDNTIRYSNAGIRDLQHGAAILFSDLITYDAKYYKSTDAAAYYDAYGDIVGGIGSYPILASPHYHQVHDVLETINHQLVAEVSKVTVASVMLMASSPARITGLVVGRRGRSVEVTWTPAPEHDVTHYVVAYGPPDDPWRTSITAAEPLVTLEDLEAGSVIAVKAVNQKGMKSWDWARAEVAEVANLDPGLADALR